MRNIKIFFIAFILFLSHLVCAQGTFHFVYFSDTNDSEVGKSSEEANRYFINNFLPLVKKQTGMEVKKYAYYGSDFTRSKLNSVLSSLSTNKDDVIFFYYTGHGYNDDTNDFPILTLGLRGDDLNTRTKPLLTVYNTLRSKPHRLLFVGAEACNSVYKTRQVSGSIVSGYDVFEGENTKIRKLFLESSGDYLISSSKKNQKSYCPLGGMGYFSTAFRDAIDSREGGNTWTSFLNLVASNTFEYAEKYAAEDQQPQWLTGEYKDSKAKIVEKETAANAQIKSISVSKDQDLDDGKGLIVHVALDVQNMKGKEIRVSAYFYDNDGNALIDKNNDYHTQDGKVSTGKSITPTSDKSTFSDIQLEIPYSELHLSGTSSRTLKLSVSVWNRSTSPSKEICSSSSYTSFTYTPVSEASYLIPSQTNISVSHTGGTRTITVSADGHWDFGVGTDYWIDLSRSGNTITLDIDSNPNDEERDDYLTIKSGSIEKRITINQSGNNNPSAEINKVWVVHNVQRTGYNTGYNSYYDFYLGWQQIPYSVPYTYNVMQIHVDFDVNHMKGKTVRVCAFFYDKDGNVVKTTNNQFRATDGQLTVQNTGNSIYENSTWSDFQLEIPNSVMTKGDYKFHIQIQDSNGHALCNSDYYYFQIN